MFPFISYVPSGNGEIMIDPEFVFIGGISDIGNNYKTAIKHSGVKQVIDLSSIGAHLDKENGFLIFHHNVE